MMHLQDGVVGLMGQFQELRRARTPSPRMEPQLATPQAISPASLSPLSIPGYSPGLFPWMAFSPHSAVNSIWSPAPIPVQQHPPSATAALPGTLEIAQIRSLLQKSDSVDISDICTILEDERHSIPFRERRKADLIVITSQFRTWMVSSKSTELLVHGDFRGPRSDSAHISALSVFCATLTQTARAQSGQQHIVLVFFCGCHVERDDQHRGGKGIVRSFIAQLVRSLLFDTGVQQVGQPQLDGQKDAEKIIRKGNLSQLYQLLGRLVKLLPEGVTLICLIDGISHYETDEFEDDVLEVLEFLLGLVRSGGMAAAIKLLVTTPTTTDVVQRCFKEDDEASFISLAEVRDLGQGLGLSQLENISDDDEKSIASDDSEDSEKY